MRYDAEVGVASTVKGRRVCCNVVDKFAHLSAPAVGIDIEGARYFPEGMSGNPCFTPTEARKLADALYKAAQECEQEIAKREKEAREAERAKREKVPLIRDPDGFVGGMCDYPLWFIARGGEVLGYFSPEESARNYVRVSGAQLCKLDIGPITAARHRAFAYLLEQAKAAGV